MTKNTKGGKGFKKGKKTDSGCSMKQLIIKQDGEEYATITKILGNCRLTCSCHDGIERLGIIRGKLVKKVWIGVGDIVIVSIRDFQNSKCDIIHKYNPSDVKELIKNKYIMPLKPSIDKPSETASLDEEEEVVETVVFDDEDNIDFGDI